MRVGTHLGALLGVALTLASAVSAADQDPHLLVTIDDGRSLELFNLEAGTNRTLLSCPDEPGETPELRFGFSPDHASQDILSSLPPTSDSFGFVHYISRSQSDGRMPYQVTVTLGGFSSDLRFFGEDEFSSHYSIFEHTLSGFSVSLKSLRVQVGERSFTGRHMAEVDRLKFLHALGKAAWMDVTVASDQVNETALHRRIVMANSTKAWENNEGALRVFEKACPQIRAGSSGDAAFNLLR